MLDGTKTLTKNLDISHMPSTNFAITFSQRNALRAIGNNW